MARKKQPDPLVHFFPKGAKRFIRARIAEFKKLEKGATGALIEKLEWQDLGVLRVCLRGQARDLARRELRAFQALIVWVYLTLIATVISGVLTTAFLLGDTVQSGDVGTIAVAAYGVALLMTIFLPRLRRVMQWRASWFQVGMIVFLLVLVITWGAGGAFASGDFFPRYASANLSTGAAISLGIAAGVAGSFVSSIIFFLAVVLFTAIRRVFVRKSTEEIVAIRIARVIAWLQGSDSQYRDNAYRRQMCVHLEAAAGVLEHGFPKMLWLPAKSSDIALRSYFRAASQHLREYQLWIMAPGPSTRSDLLRELARMYGAIALRELDLLTTSPTLQLGRPDRLRSALAQIWTVVGGFLPLAVVLVLQWRGVKLPSPLDTGAITLGAIWAFASIMMLIDPLFSTRLANVKEISQAFRGIGGSGGKGP